MNLVTTKAIAKLVLLFNKSASDIKLKSTTKWPELIGCYSFGHTVSVTLSSNLDLLLDLLQTRAKCDQILTNNSYKLGHTEVAIHGVEFAKPLEILLEEEVP
jgi:hypothetical protein